MNIKKIVKFIFFNFKAIYLYLFCNSRFDINNDVIIFITHNLGGGTEHYVQQQRLNQCAILRKIGFGTDYFFEIEYQEKRKYITKKDLFNELTNFKSYFINSLVGYSMKEEILKFLVREKEKRDIKLQYVLHDFDCLCKYNFNLVKNGVFCKLECSKCRKNDNDYNNNWRNFLLQCDEICCFSCSSKEFLLQKYNDIDKRKVNVIPHKTEYCKKFTPVKLSSDELHIGFVGNCNSISKGKQIVIQFLKFSRRKKIKISIVGKYNIENRVWGRNIHYLGRYNNDNLGNILEREGVNVVFFTSIWPETFSYLISELIALEVPVCCFDVGAQAEKIKSYKYGKIIQRETSQQMFSQILSFWNSIQ